MPRFLRTFIPRYFKWLMYISLLLSSTSLFSPQIEASLTVDVIQIAPAVNSGAVNEVAFDAVVSADGRYLIFSSKHDSLKRGSANDDSDIYVYDEQTMTLTRLSEGVPSNARPGQPDISDDGQQVVFYARDGSYTQIYHLDRTNDSTTRISNSTTGGAGDNYSYYPTISGDGAHIAFLSFARNLITNDVTIDEDIYVYDQMTE